jgi:hypothetical protein
LARERIDAVFVWAKLHIDFRQRLRRGLLFPWPTIVASAKIALRSSAATPVLLRARTTLVTTALAILSRLARSARTITSMLARFAFLAALVFREQIFVRGLLRPRG